MYSDIREPGDFDALVRQGRMERSVAVGDAIASLITATMFGLSRALDSFKSDGDNRRTG